MRREVVGAELAKTTLRTLGLTQGKGLFRFFYKKPEVLKEQANVYDMKVPVKVSPEPEPVPVKSAEPATKPATTPVDDTPTTSSYV